MGDFDPRIGRCVRNPNALKVKRIFKYLVNMKGTIYCNGEKYKPEKHDDLPLWEFEIKDNDLYIFTDISKGRNRYAVMEVYLINTQSKTKKRKTVVTESTYYIRELAIQRAQDLYLNKHKKERPKNIYSYDVEVRYYRTATDYDLLEFKSGIDIADLYKNQIEFEKTLDNQ